VRGEEEGRRDGGKRKRRGRDESGGTRPPNILAYRTAAAINAYF